MIEVYIKKADKSISIDFDNLPTISKDYIIEYGLRQCINDAHSSITTTTNPDDQGEVAFSIAEHKVEQLQAGEIRTARTATSPIAKEVTKLWNKWLREVTGQTTKQLDALAESAAEKLMEGAEYLTLPDALAEANKRIVNAICERADTTQEAKQAEFEAKAQEYLQAVAETKVDFDFSLDALGL